MSSKHKNEKSPFLVVEPYDGTVNPAELLNEIRATIQRHIVCSDETTIAATLWIAFTWFIDSVNVAPIAMITAPEKRCGKSQMLSLLGKLVARPLVASNITPAALFRAVEKWHPTLLIDEADTFLKKSDELRGILNAGHTRDSASVIRLVGDTHEPAVFNVWGAKAIAGIGYQADTIMDRSVVLELRRKMQHETVDRLRHTDDQQFNLIKSKLDRFRLDYSDAVAASRPTLPDKLNDRAQDNWEPLLAIAGVAGDGWPELAINAALLISVEKEQTESINTELLADIQEIFAEKNVERLSSKALIQALCEDEDKQWATYNRGFQIKPAQLCKRLKSFGINNSKNIRTDFGVLKGYELVQFKDAFERYLPHSSEAATAATELQGNICTASDVACNLLRSEEEDTTATYKSEPIQ